MPSSPASGLVYANLGMAYWVSKRYARKNHEEVTVSGGDFIPPYLAFGTFRNFLQGLNPERVPARIDRSLMIGMAGGTQTYLLQALRQFELIDEEGRASRALVDLAGGDEAFKAAMDRLVRRFYADQLALSDQQGTAAQLTESFAGSGYQGSTLRKAITFFLNAAAAADIALSPHFRSPNPGRSTTGARKKPRPKPAIPPIDVAQVNGAAEQRTVQLKSGGTLTISCSTTFMELSREDRAFVFGLVDQLDDYQGGSPGDDRSDALAKGSGE